VSVQPSEDQRPPVNDSFVERLFAVMCEHVPTYPGESFPDQVRRWYEALGLVSALQPRTSAEYLLAADVAMKSQFMLEVLARGRGPAGRERQRQSREFLLRAQDFQTARLGYDLARAKPIN
jgi:hypothetical protein